VSHFVVGLTGGIGSGKSRVADLFVECGAALVDTDTIAHELTGAYGQAMPELIAAFGQGIADARGGLNRAAMRKRVFAVPEERHRLESIMHPLIRQVAEERCQAATAPYVILAVPLLIESGGYRQRCNRVLVVDCPEALQISRVMARNGMSAEEVRAIMAVQASRQQRLAAADDVIANDSDLTDLKRQVVNMHMKYLALLAEIPKASC
jgi:dephospho-CoA kinase